jgi:hypothetical protein
VGAAKPANDWQFVFRSLVAQHTPAFGSAYYNDAAFSNSYRAFTPMPCGIQTFFERRKTILVRLL